MTRAECVSAEANPTQEICFVRDGVFFGVNSSSCDNCIPQARRDPLRVESAVSLAVSAFAFSPVTSPAAFVFPGSLLRFCWDIAPAVKLDSFSVCGQVLFSLLRLQSLSPLAVFLSQFCIIYFLLLCGFSGIVSILLSLSCLPPLDN